MWGGASGSEQGGTCVTWPLPGGRAGARGEPVMEVSWSGVRDVACSGAVLGNSGESLRGDLVEGITVSDQSQAWQVWVP